MKSAWHISIGPETPTAHCNPRESPLRGSNARGAIKYSQRGRGVGITFCDTKSLLLTNVTDLIFLRKRGRLKEFLDRRKEARDFAVVLLDFSGEVFVARQDLADPDKRAHDGDVDLDGALAFENARKHCHALLCKDPRQFSLPAPSNV